MSFEEAYKIEQEYLAITDTKQADEFYFKEKMELAGYPDLSVYFEEKKEYEYKNSGIEIQETCLENLKESIADAMSSNKNIWYNIPSDKNWVYVGSDDYNNDYCQQNNISILNLGYSGGTIITTPYDFAVVIVINQHDLFDLFQQKISNMLTAIGIDNTIDGNDILVNGFKVSGSAESASGDYSIYYYQISFKVDLDLIKSISSKEIIKEPKGISDIYPNITRDNLIGEILKCQLL